MTITYHRVTYIDAATGTEWGGEASACSYASAADAVASLKKRNVPKMFFDGYMLDFTSVNHTGVLIRTEFEDREA